MEIPDLCATLKPLVGFIGVEVWKSKDGFVTNALKRRKEIVAKAHIDLRPIIDDTCICDTCGTVGQCHPVTSYCFICDTDNWRRLQAFE